MTLVYCLFHIVEHEGEEFEILEGIYSEDHREQAERDKKFSEEASGHEERYEVKFWGVK